MQYIIKMHFGAKTFCYGGKKGNRVSMAGKQSCVRYTSEKRAKNTVDRLIKSAIKATYEIVGVGSYGNEIY